MLDDNTLWYDDLINKLKDKYDDSPELATPQQERKKATPETSSDEGTA